MTSPEAIPNTTRSSYMNGKGDENKGKQLKIMMMLMDDQTDRGRVTPGRMSASGNTPALEVLGITGV